MARPKSDKPRRTIQVRLLEPEEIRTVKILSAKYFGGNESAFLRHLIRAAGQVQGIIPPQEQPQEAELAEA